jgi:hypothetical protein
MFDEGSAVDKEKGAVCDGQQPGLNNWFCCWDNMEALARDAKRLNAKCGVNCSVEELADWRERVHTQLKTLLREEAEIFELISSRETQQAKLPAATIEHAA